MRMRTVTEAVEELKEYGISASALRRGIEEGKYPYLMIGRRAVLDVDVIAEILAADRKPGSVGIKEVCCQTGLTDSAIRRGINSGWIPYWIEGKAYRFDLEKVFDAILARMQGGRAER